MIPVLYVDGSSRRRKDAERFFKADGEIAVDTVPSARLATIKAGGSRYGAIVLDYPEKAQEKNDMIVFLREQGLETPVILLTRWQDRESEHEAGRCSGITCIRNTGPVQIPFRELCAVIRLVTGEAKERRCVLL